MNKISLQSDGTIETGKKIINYLETLGGVNLYKLSGAGVRSVGSGAYYYIDSSNIIRSDYSIPNGQTLFDINLSANTSEEDKVLMETLIKKCIKSIK